LSQLRQEGQDEPPSLEENGELPWDLPAEEPSPDKPPDSRGQDTPEWLTRIRARKDDEPESPGDLPEQPSDPSPKDEFPDWLSRMRSETGEQSDQLDHETADAYEDVPAEAFETKEIPGLSFRDQTDEGAQEPDGEGEIPDWLKSLRPESPPEGDQQLEKPSPPVPAEIPEEDEAPPSGDVPDWLPDASPTETFSEGLKTRDLPGLSMSAEESPEAEGESPVWLRDLRPAGEAIQPPTETPPPTEPTLPTEPILPTEPTLPAELGTPPDWLTDVAPEEPTPEAFETKDIPGLSFGEGETPEPAEELPAWLSDLRPEADVTQPPTEAPPSPEPTLPTELTLPTEPTAPPDWLTDGTTEEPSPEAFETKDIPGLSFGEEETPEPAEELPAWLRDLRPEDEAIEEPSIEGISDGEELPDWLQSDAFEAATPSPAETRELPEPTFETEIAPTDEDISIDETPALEEGIPAVEDWFADEETDREPAISLEEGDLPDWLRGLQAAQDGMIPESEAPVFTELDEPVEPVEAVESEEIPTWLSDLKAPPLDMPAEVSETAFEPDEELLPTFEEQVGEPEPDVLVPGQLPDWVSDLSPEQAALEDGPSDVEEEEVSLEPAELPGWLKAMRPVEAISPTTTGTGEPEQGVEGIGPLAGLHGILPAEPEITQAGKTPSFSIRVQVNKNQSEHIQVLKELLNLEADPPLYRPRPALIQPQNILRWAIGLGLILVILFSLLVGLGTPLPAVVPAETLDAATIVSNLSEQSSVLVAIDYQPGLSAELDAAATPFIDHMILIRGVRLAFVSTSPTGPALAERLVNNPQGVGVHNYRHGEHYVNLGFIPGGAAGLLEFATSPRITMPDSFNNAGIPEGSNAWATPPLEGIGALRDFALVVIVVDDPNTARAWIEQVQPELGETPFVLVTSAQAAPLVQPYYEAAPKQVDGLISGLAGGVAYEKINQESNFARSYWDAFSSGVIIAELLIVIGGTFGVFITFVNFSRREPGELEEPT
jgi:hypothetical protein